jgi:formate hydrogenlyase subunit 6/NADH:ubiquinone oxidoreductase subunit I
MAYAIDPGPCINCGLCRLACPTGTVHYFSTGRRRHEIDAEWCIDCAICAQVCPVACIASHPEVVPAPEQRERAKERARAFARSGRLMAQELDADVRRVIARRLEAALR